MPTAAPKVKICGIRTPDAYEAAASADYVGFVFFPPSPRFVTPATARALAVGHMQHVGLFVDPADDQIAEVLDSAALDILQLYDTTAERAAAIRARFDRPVWRAIGVRAMSDLPASLDGADAVLLDAKAPAGASRPGGNARTFDWSMLSGWRAPGAWLLAGRPHARECRRCDCGDQGDRRRRQLRRGNGAGHERPGLDRGVPAGGAGTRGCLTRFGRARSNRGPGTRPAAPRR